MHGHRDHQRQSAQKPRGGVQNGAGFGRGRGRGHGAGRAASEGTLAGLRAGDRALIAGIADDTARAQATRFGMGEGAQVSCVTALPGGPIIVRSGRQEIAIGRGLARRITIDRACEVTDGFR